MQVEEFLERSAERYPEKIALVCGSRRLSYGEIELRANKLAHALIEQGVKRSDRVAIYSNNSVECALAVFGILKAGGIFLLVNPTTKKDKLAYILNNCRATTLIAAERLLPTAIEAAKESPFVTCILTTASSERIPTLPEKRLLGLDAACASEPATRCSRKNIDLDLAALIYTSGSTGHPKGVMMTHLNIVSAANSITEYLENTPDDVIMNVLPLSFDYGLYQLLMAFKVGGRLVLEQSFTYPRAVLETLVDQRVTGFPIVPTISSILLQMDLTQYDFSSLRYITNTAAALPVEHIRKLREQFPRVRIYSMYGLTECKRVSYLSPDQIDMRPESVGRGMPNEEVYIVNEAGERVAPGVVGELVVRGTNVMRGYWELPEETDRALRPGWYPGEKVLYTGDLFRMDADGYLYFVGRKDDIIKTRGEKVSPREVEDVLYSHPMIAEAAVTAVPDAVLGQAICAFVSLRPGSRLTEQQLLGFCADRLEDFMVPKIVRLCDRLPKSANGKIAKKVLSVDAAVHEGVAQ